MENKNNIHEELKQLSPMLAAKQKVNLFSVPENYFSVLESKVMEKIATQSVQRELQNTSLGKTERQEVFDVPYGYFERLPEQILNKTSRRKNSWSSVFKSFPLGEGFRVGLAAAPALAVIILSVIFLSQPSVVIEKKSSVTQVSSEEISGYLSVNISSVDESAIVAQLDDEAMKKLSAKIELPVSESDFQLQDFQNIDLSDIQNL